MLLKEYGKLAIAREGFSPHFGAIQKPNIKLLTISEIHPVFMGRRLETRRRPYRINHDGDPSPIPFVSLAAFCSILFASFCFFWIRVKLES